MIRIIVNHFVAAVIMVAAAFTSCSNKVINDVYVVGYEKNAQGINVATLWKNGIAQRLTDGTRNAIAESVFVLDNDVYVVGYEKSGQEYEFEQLLDDYSDEYDLIKDYYSIATLWKNGVVQNLTDGIRSNAYANSVFVSGSDVYVAGSIGSIAVLWKNGIAQNLTDGTRSASANSVFVSGNDVYVLGREVVNPYWGYDIVTLWKNGVVQNLTDGNFRAFDRSFFVSGNDVYITGYAEEIGSSRNYKLWKNGIVQNLTDGNFDGIGGASSVFVSGNDVYLAGHEGNCIKLWKNGITQNLTDGTRFIWGSISVYVLGSDVYVAGNERTGKKYHRESYGNEIEDYYSVATLWKNGVAQKLSDGTRNAFANSVFVVD